MAARARLAAALMALLLGGCAAHSPMNVSSRTDVAPAAGAATVERAPHAGRVRVMTGELPAGVEFEPVAVIDVGRSWYGELDWVDRALAARARALGADAVIRVRRWHQPSGFSWASPHGRGEAVKLRAPASTDLDALPGAWF